ncbi:hypothetical protein J1N35_000365 [Gossypium stocksii]|uniref:Aminotransferase-like plant mobile domain-containing protein n=1 Tax=Gossypium stocksii TaxID=47602 RepID=A0A9D4AK17_9ROSI|nr:hypothetical protein J1N35_000365 [Gossypium stocksii]
MECSSRVNAANTDVDDKKTRRSTHIHIPSLVTLMPRMELRQATQIEAGHVYVEAVRKATAVNSRRPLWSPTINVLLFRLPMTTEHLQALPTTAVHCQPLLTTADHSMDPNPNIILNDNNYIAAYVHKSHIDLISALVERWHPETHTFHLLSGEVIITLQDVAVQLGLSINGEAVTGLRRLPDLWGTCERLLGRVPPTTRKDD